ncbi:zeta toxin family protein [Pseudomonas sp. TH43]|uniref:zeta toxin family protein n=1 Tax=Pseudomonas sp. TH43 TaxID=2796407 RepID=UPI001911FBA1|nr:zeta toxin family protein [Pseudomonas sp. TH43]MBK5373251.1 zeta toxin family protein [Pseudomonas sp. TH43]
MTIPATYSHTPEQLTAAFTEISATLFAAATAEASPKLLITAGVQSSGKTWLLEKTLLPTGKYSNYVRLYLPEYRKKHPQYQDMLKLGVLHAYEHTETFIRELGGKIFEKAFTQKLNIIMECAFDSIDFATLAATAVNAGYQFEVHIVACSQPFAFMSGFKRAFKSLEKQEPERFVRPSVIKSSLATAHAVVFALEAAARQSDGSQIFLYERGMGALKERAQRAHSLYAKDETGKLTITSTAGLPAYNYAAYELISGRSITGPSEHHELIKECHLMLLQCSQYAEQLPDYVYDALYSRIFRYAQR